MASLLNNSPVQVVIFLFSTFAFESTSLPDAALIALRYLFMKLTYFLSSFSKSIEYFFGWSKSSK